MNVLDTVIRSELKALKAVIIVFIQAVLALSALSVSKAAGLREGVGLYAVCVAAAMLCSIFTKIVSVRRLEKYRGDRLPFSLFFTGRELIGLVATGLCWAAKQYQDSILSRMGGGAWMAVCLVSCIAGGIAAAYYVVKMIDDMTVCMYKEIE